MIHELFTAADFVNAEQGDTITDSFDARGMLGFVFTNATPFWYRLTDDNNTVIAMLQPWAWTFGGWRQDTRTITITSVQNSYPSLDVKGQSTDKMHVEYELSSNAQSPHVVQMSLAAAANIDVTTTGTVGIDGSANIIRVDGTPTVQFASGQSVSINGTPQMEITGTPTVNVAQGQVVEVTNASGGTLTVAGTVDANLPAGTTVDINGQTINVGNAIQTARSKTTSTLTIPSFNGSGPYNTTFGNYWSSGSGIDVSDALHILMWFTFSGFTWSPNTGNYEIGISLMPTSSKDGSTFSTMQLTNKNTAGGYVTYKNGSVPTTTPAVSDVDYPIMVAGWSHLGAAVSVTIVSTSTDSTTDDISFSCSGVTVDVEVIK